MAKSVDAADLKSAALDGAYGFKSRSGHQLSSDLAGSRRFEATTVSRALKIVRSFFFVWPEGLFLAVAA